MGGVTFLVPILASFFFIHESCLAESRMLDLFTDFFEIDMFHANIFHSMFYIRGGVLEDSRFDQEEIKKKNLVIWSDS